MPKAELLWNPIPYEPRQVELDNPFGLGDGWFYFTSGGNVVRVRDGAWQLCSSLKERINAVVVQPDGSLACVGAKGVLHRCEHGRWSKLKLGLEGHNVSDLIRLGDGRLLATAWSSTSDSASQIAFIDGLAVTRYSLNKRLFACTETPQGELLVAGDGIFRFDGRGFELEHDVWAMSLHCHDGSVFAGGAQVGLAGRAALHRRRADRTWEVIESPLVADRDLFSFASFQGALYVANVVRLARVALDGSIEIAREGLARYLGLANDCLVGASGGVAFVFDGRAWTSIRP